MNQIFNQMLSYYAEDNDMNVSDLKKSNFFVLNAKQLGDYGIGSDEALMCHCESFQEYYLFPKDSYCPPSYD